MELYQIILSVLVILIVVYVVAGYIFPKTTQLSSMLEGTKSQTVEASSLPSNNNSLNYTYSTWIYVEDWNYKFGEKKTVLGRLDNDKNPSPSIELGAMENDLTVSISCYPKQQSGGANSGGAVKPIIHKCKVQNIPLQRWVNIIVSLYGRTLDVYIDGKLVRTCMLPGVAKISQTSPVVITPNGGFSGWTSNFQYWANASSPQQAYDIYKNGYGASGLGNFFNKYRLKFAFMEDNMEKGSFEI
jgi:hypothetical protein